MHSNKVGESWKLGNYVVVVLGLIPQSVSSLFEWRSWSGQLTRIVPFSLVLLSETCFFLRTISSGCPPLRRRLAVVDVVSREDARSTSISPLPALEKTSSSTMLRCLFALGRVPEPSVDVWRD